MLLNFAFEDKDHRNAGGSHPQHSIRRSCHCERPGPTHVLLEVLDIQAERRCQENARSFFGFFGALYPIYVRGLANLAEHQGTSAAVQFQKILGHPGTIVSDPIGTLAHLQLGRAFAMSGDKAKAKAAYQDFLTLWKDADTDIPILAQTNAEFSKLQ